MKKYELLCLFIGFLIVSSGCDRLKQNHPQATLGKPDSLLSENQIIAYADSINKVLSTLKSRQSLVFNNQKQTFFVSEYRSEDTTVMYREQGEKNDIGTYEERYYLKDGQIVLHTYQAKGFSEQDPVTFGRDFVRNNVVFYSEQKQARNREELAEAAFKNTSSATLNLSSELNRLKDAVNGDGEFDLAFERITEYPQARYIILSGEQSPYRAAILVEKQDDFVKELSANPDKYNGSKLDLQWRIRNGSEAVYVNGNLEKVF